MMKLRGERDTNLAEKKRASLINSIVRIEAERRSKEFKYRQRRRMMGQINIKA